MPFQKTPPLNAVKVFTAIVHNGSISKASSALCVGQSSVSRHLKKLEEFLGVKLVERSSNGIILTEKGQHFYQRVDSAMSEVQNAVVDLRSAEPNVHCLNISAPSSFTQRWLAPRLHHFHLNFPQTKINVEISDDCPDLMSSSLQGAIFTCNNNEALDGFHLFDECMILVCSPSFLENYSVSRPEDVPQLPVVHTLTRPEIWEIWKEKYGLKNKSFHKMDLGFQDFHLTIASVISSSGLALVPSFLIQEELSKGSLVTPIDAHCATGRSYKVRLTPSKSLHRSSSDFIDWLLEETGEIGVR